jgi:hypothetical protein
MIQRLQNAYPAISLEKAYKYIEAVSKNVEDDVAITRKTLSRLMGFTSLSGTATNAAGSLVHFRLLRRVEGGLHHYTTSPAVGSSRSRFKPMGGSRP